MNDNAVKAEDNNPYVMPDGNTQTEFAKLEPGVYAGTLVDFGVSESHPIVFLEVRANAELTLIDPTHRKSKKKNWGRYEPANLKCIGKIDDDNTYRISLFVSEETSKYPQFYRNSQGELKKVPFERGDMPKDAILLSQREEVLIELSRIFNLAGKEIPHPDGAGFLECLAVFLDQEISGQKVIFQAKDNGDYTNYFLKSAVSDEQLSKIKGF